MGLIEYIKGKRYGKDANKLERESMEDAFLQEALDGYDAVLSNHIDSIERLQTEITQKSIVKKQRQHIFYWSVAAGVVLVLGVGSMLIFSPLCEELIAKNSQQSVEDTPINNTGSEVSIQYDTLVKAKQDNVKPAEKKPLLLDEKAEKPKEVKPEEKKVLAKVEITKDKKNVDTTRKAKVKSTQEQKISSERLAEVALTGKTVAKAAHAKAVDAMPSITENVVFDTPKAFDKRTFKNYFVSRAKKMCGDSPCEVEVEFVLNNSQFPSGIKVKKTNSEEATQEAIRVISSSPQWTEKAGERVKMKLKW